MKRFRIITFAAGTLLAASELARWWGSPRLVPLAFDEVLIGAALAFAALATRRLGPGGLAAAWGAFCGLMLSLLVPTLDHLLNGPPKPSAGFYGVVLTAMLALGVAALAHALTLGREGRRAR
ncbi:hypothetical protein [Sphingosinicella soli]|uniref:Uncharacterized protein n=1 Tax=Sphingosinicella soli TaxID=333708 RepID=A0A7W7F838_9SPHN|nr:hypothetical protein [Sphingosinicella soli]MBB4633334.1 hypothetical protein [Sphingosinicella soli]